MSRKAMPADADTVRASIAHQHEEEGKRPSTLRRSIIAIRMVHESFDQPWPDVDEELIKMMKSCKVRFSGTIIRPSGDRISGTPDIFFPANP